MPNRKTPTVSSQASMLSSYGQRKQFGRSTRRRIRKVR